MASPMIYKGRPVVRDGNKVYFGEPYNKFMVVFTVLENVNELPSRILVQLQNTDPALAMTSEKIVKEAERKNLFDAFELASVWLEKQLAE